MAAKLGWPNRAGNLESLSASLDDRKSATGSFIMPLGYLCLVLHAHLLYVRHPEYDDFLEEDWFYEAITETYIPLLEMMEGLERDGADWRLTMSVTPTLAAMFADPLLQLRYVRHIDNLIALSAKEIERTKWTPEFHHLAHMYHNRFIRARDVFAN